LGDENSSGAPWLRGFDEFAGYFAPADIANPYSDFIWRYEPDRTNADVAAFNGPEAVSANADGQPGQYIPDWLATLSNTFIKKHKPFWFNHYQPFFLELNCPLPGNGDRVPPSDAPYSEESWPPAEKNRAAMISRLDGYLGQLLQQLDKVNETSNTVIIFTSDTVPKKAHGIDPKFFQESSSPDSLKVPMMASWPGKIPAGEISDRDCSARDLLPTVAGIGLVTPPKEIDGVPFLNAWPQPASTQPPNASGSAH
jgi:arylsulfatase A-like enzyme